MILKNYRLLITMVEICRRVVYRVGRNQNYQVGFIAIKNLVMHQKDHQVDYQNRGLSIMEQVLSK